MPSFSGSGRRPTICSSTLLRSPPPSLPHPPPLGSSPSLERELEEEGVRAYVQVEELRLEGDDLRFRTREDGEVLVLGVTALVDAAGREALPPPPALLEGFEGEVLRLGDAREPGSIFEALAGGAERFRGG